MNSETEKIIERIKKLLELTTSPNENEASLAMEQAQKLMLKYSLRESDIAGEKVEDKVIMSEWTNPALEKIGIIDQIPSIISIISPIFGCYALLRTSANRIKEIEIYGFEANIEIAKYAIDSVIAQGLADARREYRKHRTTLFHLSFWTGFVAGLNRKFGPINNESKGLVVYDKVKEYVGGLANGAFGSKKYDGSAYDAGVTSGESAQIRQGIKSQNSGKLLN